MFNGVTAYSLIEIKENEYKFMMRNVCFMVWEGK